METNEKRMTLSELAELINNSEEWKLEFNDIIQANLWYSDYSEEESYKICQSDTELLYFDDNGKAETRALEEDEVICSDKRTIETTYLTAVNWLNNSRILCNDICRIDETFWDNCRFDLEEGDEIFQFFLTNCTESDVEFLEEHFGLLFAYSELLDLYVLCVNHYGTHWDSVPCYTDIEMAAKTNN